MKVSLFPKRRAPVRRASEANPAQLAVTGAAGAGYGGYDPVDGEHGWRAIGPGGGPREMPWMTRERQRTYSVAAYRYNPMAKAIVDTYIAFCVGDKGVSLEGTNPDVLRVASEFWDDPAVALGQRQELLLRDAMLAGEQLLELMSGQHSHAVRFAPVEVSAIEDITSYLGNPLWPHQAVLRRGGDEMRLDIARVDDLTGLRSGEASFFAPWKTVATDTRSQPFLATVLDWLDSYDTVLSNLIDRTALARYIVWDVEVQGTQDDVDAYVKSRGGNKIPRSGSVEVHNDKVTWSPKVADTGAYQDNAANKSVLTMAAAGSGLAKTWLSDPEDANRATSQSMAEPVRRRVGSVQRMWLDYQTELPRFAIDQAVRVGRLPRMVEARDPRTGERYQVPAAQTVSAVGPEVAAADSQIAAQVMLNLATGLEKLRTIGALSEQGASLAAKRCWEQFMGVPYVAELDKPDTDRDKLADHIDSAKPLAKPAQPAVA
jgi:hypothetical protein